MFIEIKGLRRLSCVQLLSRFLLALLQRLLSCVRRGEDHFAFVRWWMNIQGKTLYHWLFQFIELKIQQCVLTRKRLLLLFLRNWCVEVSFNIGRLIEVFIWLLRPNFGYIIQIIRWFYWSLIFLLTRGLFLKRRCLLTCTSWYAFLFKWINWIISDFLFYFCLLGSGLDFELKIWWLLFEIVFGIIFAHLLVEVTWNCLLILLFFWRVKIEKISGLFRVRNALSEIVLFFISSLLDFQDKLIDVVWRKWFLALTTVLENLIINLVLRLHQNFKTREKIFSYWWCICFNVVW